MTELYNPDAKFFDPAIKDKKRIERVNTKDDIRFFSALLCEKNKLKILSVISPLFSRFSSVLEISSSTGMNSQYYVEDLPQLTWHTSDCAQFLADIRARVLEADCPNVRLPVELDITKNDWPDMDVDAIFTANSLHIYSDKHVSELFDGVASTLNKWGSFVVYGPFISNDQSGANSEEQLNKWLKHNDPLSGIKHLDDVVQIASDRGLQLIRDYVLPENNRILHFVKMGF